MKLTVPAAFALLCTTTCGTAPSPVSPPPTDAVDVRFSGTLVSNRARFEFRPFPSRSTNGTISFCDARGGAAQRAIVISYTGRPRLAAPDADSGLPACATG